MLKKLYKLESSAQILKACRPLLLCLVLLLAAKGQAIAQSGAFSEIVQDLDLHRKKALQEKLFLHIDRPAYACGETMWFKVYNVDGVLHKPLDLSRVAYVEVLDATQKPVLQGKIPLKAGKGNGSFILPATLSSGKYTVRAYTNWMKNFSPEFYFEQTITILNTFQNLEAVSVPEELAYGVQFFPEGGNIVAGAANKVAFKVTNKDTGKGAAFKGELHDQVGNKVADLEPYKFGIGHVTFTPVAGQKYTATFSVPGSKKITQALPVIHDQGFVLNLDDSEADKIKLTVNQVGLQAEQLYLLGHARQMIAVSETETVNQGVATFIINKSALADGITHFTVFNSQKKPVLERLYFKRPAKALQLQAKTDKLLYSTREKVSLDLLAQTSSGKATTADLSLAVYKLDSLQGTPAKSIESFLWLSSDLKGTIENPTYYFSEAGATDARAMDNLMLTHGWSRFNWDAVLGKQPAAYTFVPEYSGHWITGKVTHRTTGEPAPGITTYLASPGKLINLYNSKSDANGLIKFEVTDLYGPKEIVLQSNFLQDSAYHFEVFSPFSDNYSAANLPALHLSKNMEQDITQRHIQAQVQHAYFNDLRNRLKVADVDSVDFYGTADETYLLDDYKRFKVMEEVMREYVPGVQVRLQKGNFRFMTFNRPHESIFQKNPMVMLDGVPVFNINKIMAFDPRKVKKLEVVTSRFFTGPLTFDGIVSYTTYKGDLAGFDLDPKALLQEYEGLQFEREFYTPVYETDDQKQSRLADFRNLLYWAPEVQMENGKEKTINFYTSDQVGTYLIVVQGINSNGLAGSSMFKINVSQPL